MRTEVHIDWNEHHSTLVGVFKKLLDKSTLVDCTIAAEGQYLKAHKIVLSACSPYFEMLFSQESEKNPIVVLKDIKFQELRALIDFIYCGKVQVDVEHLERFRNAAESLQIKGLGGRNRKRNISEQRATESSSLKHNKQDHMSPPHLKRYRSSYTKNKRVSFKEISPRNDVNFETKTNKKLESHETHVEVASSSGNDTCPLFINLKENSVTLPFSECSEVQEGPNLCEGDLSFATLIESTFPLPSVSREETVIETEESTSVAESSLLVSEQHLNSKTVIIKKDPELLCEEFLSDMDSSVEQESEVVIQETLLDSATNETEAAINGIQDDHQYSVVPTAVQATFSSSPSSSSAAVGKEGTLLFVTSEGKSFRIRKKLGTVTIREGAVTDRNSKSVRKVAAVTLPENGAPNELPPPEDNGLGNSSSSAAAFSCYVCGKQFIRSSLLQRHLLQRHKDERPYNCEVCGMTFRRLKTLKVHERIHSGERPYLCQLCGKAFKRFAHLQSHLCVHIGYRPFKCHVCGKSYVERSNLRAHMRYHTGEKPFKCDECGNAYSNSSALRSHLRTHTFKCEVCNKAFRRIETLQGHECNQSVEAALQVLETDTQGT